MSRATDADAAAEHSAERFAGEQAFWRGEAYDERANVSWRSGWLMAAQQVARDMAPYKALLTAGAAIREAITNAAFHMRNHMSTKLRVDDEVQVRASRAALDAVLKLLPEPKPHEPVPALSQTREEALADKIVSGNAARKRPAKRPPRRTTRAGKARA